ncbi:MAG: EAL domain-containing protein [Proteobacteria bacterium]|nr:EAL domain-containing protein [Pseudomonadota bacterium]
MASSFPAGGILTPTRALAAQFRGRQFQAAVAQLPMFSLVTLLLVGAALLVFRDYVEHPTVIVCTAILCLLVALVYVPLWRSWNRKADDAPASARTAWALALAVALSAVAFSCLSLYLFDLVEDQRRVMIAAVVAALISTCGWMFASLPQAALAWTASMSTVVIVGIATLQLQRYAPLVPLMALYAFALAGTILLTSRQFLQRLRAEHALTEQHQLVGLLLNDFEENASDWLWETDGDGRLTRVSARLAQTTGLSVDALHGQVLCEMLAGLAPAENDALRDRHRSLADHMRGDSAFHQVSVAVMLQGRRRWWSFTAKPLLDAAGAKRGWRGVASDVTDQRERNNELVRQANLDSLTGLGNRHFFNRRLATFFATPGLAKPCVLFMLDIDNFKTVNDSLGHAAGDVLLCEVARRLRSQVRRDAVLARLGGDEFALLVPGVFERQVAQGLGDRLQQALMAPCVINDHRIEVHASIGVGYAPQDADNAQDLLKIADMALYAAKAAGRRTLRFFERHMEVEARDKLGLLADLSDALREGQLEVHYQPQVRLRDGALIGFEALVRWRHPTRGMVPPVQFIALAEDSGLIVPLGRWVLEQACRDAAQWPGDKRVAVNVSAVEFEQADIRQVVREALRISALPVKRLELELTESTLLADSVAAIKLLQDLRDDGVRIALDDFGTGFSSLAYLRNLPLDKLKIDRSFVRTLDEQDNAQSVAIVQAIHRLASAMGLDTIAEGVETEAQRLALKRIGCHLGQGYLFAKAMTAAQTLEFIEAYDNDNVELAMTIAHLKAPPQLADQDLRVDDLRMTIGRRGVPLSHWAAATAARA